MKSTLFIIALLAFVSCKEPQHSDVMDDKLFVDIYVALLEKDVEQRPAGGVNDSLVVDRTHHILEGFGVSQEKFCATVESYRADPRRWQTFLEEVTKRLNQQIEDQRPKVDSAKTNPGQPVR